jgi:hypothetical protein
MLSKQCRRCLATMPLTQFYVDRRIDGGFMHYCAACARHNGLSGVYATPEEVASLTGAACASGDSSKRPTHASLIQRKQLTGTQPAGNSSGFYSNRAGPARHGLASAVIAVRAGAPAKRSRDRLDLDRYEDDFVDEEEEEEPNWRQELAAVRRPPSVGAPVDTFHVSYCHEHESTFQMAATCSAVLPSLQSACHHAQCDECRRTSCSNAYVTPGRKGPPCGPSPVLVFTTDCVWVAQVTRGFFREDRADEAFNDRSMEASAADIRLEEARSRRIGREEDLEAERQELRRIKEKEAKLARARAKRRKLGRGAAPRRQGGAVFMDDGGEDDDDDDLELSD